jgi:arabinan endo-1,5-alpha-L-arabinosidase
VLPALVAAALPLGTGAGAQAAGTGDTYRNPLRPRIASGGTVDSCADPTVFRGRQAGDKYWYMFCTTDPLNDQDRNAAGDFNFHKIPMMRSLDLVHWRYVGDAFADMPRIAAAGAGLWAPEVTYSTTFRKYYLFFVVTDTADAVSGEPGCTSDNAIAVATSEKPTGPWTASETPVVAPRRGGPGCNFFWTFDPDVISPSGRPDEALADNGYLYYGSYYGGIQARPLKITATGASTNEAAATQITIPNRYEAPEVVRRGSFYYLFASATNCCNGPLTGYSVFAGRSTSPLGPFVDREGVSLLAGRVGGTPVLSMNGNRWTGPGHNTVFRDFSGQWWTVYHAVNRFDPYFEGAVGFTKRPAMLDPLDWVNDWPTVRGGKWVSDRTMPAPAAQPGETTAYRPTFARPDVPGARIGALSDDFSGDTLSSQWTWVRPPAADTYGVANGRFRFNTQAGDIFQDSNTASVLTEPAPDGDYVVETRVHLNLPPEGCCYNFVQAGLVLYGHEDRFIKLTHVSIYETRQTEFAKEVPGGRTGFPRYGNTVVGPPSDWTYLRIVKRAGAAPGGEDLFTPYTSRDGRHWVRGGSYTHQLGRNERIGLVSMGGEGFVAKFDYVKVARLR